MRLLLSEIVWILMSGGIDYQSFLYGAGNNVGIDPRIVLQKQLRS